MQEEVLIPIAFFTSIVLIFYFRYRHMERQALIDKGLNAEDVKDLFKTLPNQNISNEAGMAKWGIILIAIGLAILMGTQFTDEVMLGLIFLFPGIGLLFYYYFIAKKFTVSEE